MLVAFGAAWPLSIYKSYTSRKNAGKSVIFLFVVLIGYAAGVMHKIRYMYDAVIYLYFINSFMVMIDIALYFRNSRLEREGRQ